MDLEQEMFEDGCVKCLTGRLVRLKGGWCGRGRGRGRETCAALPSGVASASLSPCSPARVKAAVLQNLYTAQQAGLDWVNGVRNQTGTAEGLRAVHPHRRLPHLLSWWLGATLLGIEREIDPMKYSPHQ